MNYLSIRRIEMKIAYIAGPYRASTHYTIELNIRVAEGVAIELWQMGFAVICPHKNSAHFDGLCRDDIWLAGDLEIISRLNPRADCLVLIPGWERSSGATGEYDFARERGLKVFWWPEDKDTLRQFVQERY
jgi:hypothetical protein